MAATLLPPGEQQFFSNAGVPLVAGTINFYVPNTSTPKNTWQDAGETILNTNPIILDGGGRAIIYGQGVYRMVLKDALGNLIWDQLTASTGDSSSTIGNALQGFNSFVITPQVSPAIPNSGLIVNLPAGTAIVNSTSVVIPALTPSLTANSITDAWLDDNGAWTFETQSTSTYTLLPHFTNMLHVWQISTGASTITAINLMGNPNWPTVFRPNDIAGTIDNFAEIFYLDPTTTNWSATLAVTYGELLLTSAGNVYQVYLPGTTGASAPTSTAAGFITDGTATLIYYCQSSYLGMFRYAPNNGTEYYFTNIGLTQICHKTLLTGSPLGEPANTTMASLVKTHLQGVFKHLIGNRVNSGTYLFGQKMITGGYIWLNTTVAGGTAAGSSPFSGTYTPGTSTVVDGTITWLCIYTSYASQTWFWMDTDRTFLIYRSPDSHDSYASTLATLLARYLQLTNDINWLTTASPQPSGSGAYWTYQQLFGFIMNQNLDIQISNFLTQTFQYNTNPLDGSSFTIQYLEDNSESVLGYKGAAYIYGVLGDATRQAAAQANVPYIGTFGVNALYNTTYNFFATHFGEDVSTWANNANIGWYPYLQAQFFPELCGVTGVTNDQFKLVRYNTSLKWPNYWNDRALDSFPDMFLGFLAATEWQDTAKAYAFVEKMERYFVSGGTIAQGALTPASATTITEWGYYLAIKDTLVPPLSILDINGNTINFLNQQGTITQFTPATRYVDSTIIEYCSAV
jgi:hypothetical protein